MTSNSKHDPRPPVVMSASRPDCDLCTWVLSPDLLVFRLKYISRMCLKHGRLLG